MPEETYKPVKMRPVRAVQEIEYITDEDDVVITDEDDEPIEVG